MRTLISKYQNGDYTFEIYSDGTLVRTSEVDNPQVVYPSSMDCKITNYCDLGCLFCFVSGTMVNMVDGTLKNIEEIQTGDSVYAYSMDDNICIIDTVGKLYSRSVFEDIITITFDDGVMMGVTGNHEIYTQRGWITADKLEETDILTGMNGSLCIRTIVKQHYTGLVYNFETLNTHTYFIEGILVHNCHEMSTVEGKHGDLEKGLSLFQQLPAGTELAIGGGNPLSHPDVVPFLEGLKAAGVIANMTMNQLHFKRYGAQLIDLLQAQLIWGLGISYHPKSIEVTQAVLEHTENDVFHLIIGVHTLADLDKLCAYRKPLRVLLLGYKEFGRGNDYFGEHGSAIERNIREWYHQLPRYFSKENITLSFDNLAIKQLKVRRFFTQEGWDRFYMGDDATFTFYIDLVESVYGGSSTAQTRYPLGSQTIQSIFANVTNKA